MRRTSLEGEIVSRARRFEACEKRAVSVEYVVERVSVGNIYQFTPHVLTSRQRPRLRLFSGSRTLDTFTQKVVRQRGQSLASRGGQLLKVGQQLFVDGESGARHDAHTMVPAVLDRVKASAGRQR